MRENIHNYFELGTITWMSYPGVSQTEVIRKLAADPFFDAIEICTFPDDAARYEGQALLSQSHMSIRYGAQPLLLGQKLNPNDPDEDGRQKAENVLLSALEEAKFLGAPGIAFLAGKWTEKTKNLCYAQLIKTTEKVCSRAKELGLSVELEVFDYDVDKASLIGPAGYAAQFAKDIRKKHSNFGLLVDLSHIPLTHETSDDAICQMAPWITHLHYGNAVTKPGSPAYGDKHPRFGYPDSANDTPELVAYLRALRSNGLFRTDRPLVLSMEVSPMPGEDADIVLASTKRTLLRAWALLED